MAIVKILNSIGHIMELLILCKLQFCMHLFAPIYAFIFPKKGNKKMSIKMVIYIRIFLNEFNPLINV